MKQLILIVSILTGVGFTVNAQDNPMDVPFDAARIPATAAKPAEFAPPGWKVERAVKGDLNGDRKADWAIKLAQIEEGREGGIGGNRALVVAFNEGDEFRRVAVADKILQCVDCGGAFYGVMPAPASVSIEKGTIVIENEHGSREVSRSTFKFRYDAKGERFLLIGYDYSGYDRLDNSVSNESTNYATNSRVTETGRGKRTRKKRSVITPARIYLEDADSDELEGAALQRLGLD